MASRTTTFPDSQEVLAFRAVEAVLREDPGLIEAGVSFRTWNGDQVDGVPISSGQCPMIRLSPVAKPSSPSTLGRNVANAGIKVELYVAGLIAEDILNFWAAVRAALVQRKPMRGGDVYCFIKSQCDAHEYSVLQPAYGSWQAATPDQGLAGVGEVVVSFQVPR
jgi:hypothetical protein